MSEDTQTETVADPTTEMVAENNQAAPETGKSLEAQVADMQAALRKANSEAAKYRKQVEAVEKAEQERKDAELSEMEKLKKRLTDAEAKAKELELKDLQREAAEKAGLPVALAVRLKGETPEELEADAKELAKTLPKPANQPGQPTNPGQNAGGGGETDAERRKRLGIG